MFSNWLGRFLSCPRKIHGRRRQAPGSSPCVEVLEDRLTPATHAWNGSPGAVWSDPLNWGFGFRPVVGEPDIILDMRGLGNSVDDIANLKICELDLGGATLSGA